MENYIKLEYTVNIKPLIMPKKVKADLPVNLYHIRITIHADDTLEKLNKFVQGIDGSYFFVREDDASNPHYHGWIRSDINMEALRKRLKKDFPECIGNKGYSLGSIRDFDDYQVYICKGTPEELPNVICYSGIQITPEYIKERYDKWWASKRSKKCSKTNRSIVDEVIEWVKLQDWPCVDEKRYEVVHQIVEIMIEKKKPINVFYLRNVRNVVMAATSNEFRQSLEAEINSKY